MIRTGRVVSMLLALLAGGCASEEDRAAGLDPAGPVYRIEGRSVVLKDGVYRSEDGEVRLIESKKGDMNSDGRDDIAAVLVLDSRGSGTFYYLNVLLDDGAGGWANSGEALLGDRIRLDFVDIYTEGSVSSLTGIAIHPADYGQAVVGFHIHADDQSYSEEPRFFLTRNWRVENDVLIAVEQY